MSGISERTRRQIALLAGDDLEGDQAEEAQRSVESCPDCRGHWLRVRGCLDALERAGKGAEPLRTPSLWPAIEAQLTRPVVRSPERFNGWVPALSMAAACVALLIAGQMDPRPPQDAVDESWAMASPSALPPFLDGEGNLAPHPFSLPVRMPPDMSVDASGDSPAPGPHPRKTAAGR